MKEILMMMIPSTVAYFIGYKKTQIKLEKDRLANLEKSIKIYHTIIEDMTKKIENLSKEITRLEMQIHDLMTENKKLKKMTL